MKYYFLGITMRSPTHDYAQIHCALMLLRARKVSPRIYMCAVEDDKSERIFAIARQCLSPDDELMIARVPQDMQPAPLRLAA